MKLERLLFAALAILPAAAFARPPAVPEAFIGAWSADPSKCGSGGDTSFLVLEPTSASIGNKHAEVLAAVVRGRELALILEFSDNGRTWLHTDQFVVSAHGGRLVSTGKAGQPERRRCNNPGAHPNNSFKPKPLRGSA